MRETRPVETTITSVENAVRVARDQRINWGVQPWWRGHEDAAWDLRPTIFRKSWGHRAEQNMLAHFLLSAPSREVRLPSRDDEAGWLFLARHHGLPTRLLDWTEAPLTALFFAVGSPEQPLERDATLWALNPHSLNERLMGKRGVFLPERQFVGPIIRRAWSGEDADGDKVVAVWPYEVDLRMLLQLSRFTIHDSNRPLEELVGDSTILVRYVIPGGARQSIGADLETLGFRESSLFPDLRTLARYISGLTYPRVE